MPLESFHNFVFHTFIWENILFVPFVALTFAIILKGITHSFRGKFSLARMFGSGGMPSAHATFVVALTTAIGIKNSVWSDMFAISFIFSIVIIYDAINVRYQSGLHARALNRLVPNDKELLNESMGHTPLEAFVGSTIGFSTAAILMYLL